MKGHEVSDDFIIIVALSLHIQKMGIVKLHSTVIGADKLRDKMSTAQCLAPYRHPVACTRNALHCQSWWMAQQKSTFPTSWVCRLWQGGRKKGRGHLFDTLVSIRYLVCIFPGADYITACVDKHLESEHRGN